MKHLFQVQLGQGFRMWDPFLTIILNGRAVARPAQKMALATNPDGSGSPSEAGPAGPQGAAKLRLSPRGSPCQWKDPHLAPHNTDSINERGQLAVLGAGRPVPGRVAELSM